MSKAGAVLAALHAAPVPAGPARRITDDAAYLARFSTPVAKTAPSLALSFDEAIRRLDSATHEEPPPVLSHGSFRSDQLLIEGDEPLMIDLDELCWANPARDVGNFLAYLRWKSIREPRHSSFIEGAIPSFLEGYGSVLMLPDERWTARYALDGDGAALLGKMYRDTARGRRVHDIMRWLWDQAASGTPELGVPRPLGWIPELSMLVYLPVSGRVLGDAIFDERAAAYM